MSKSEREGERERERERVLYIDASAGVSGDMMLGALVDLGVPLTPLKEELAKLGAGFRLVRSHDTRGGIRGTRIRVVAPDDRGYRHWADFERLVRRSKLSKPVKVRTLSLLRRLFEAEASVHGEEVEDIHLHELGSLDTIVDVAGAVIGIELLDVSDITASPVNVGSGHVDTEHGRMTIPAPATARLLEGVPIFAEAEPSSNGSALGFERTTPTGALLVTGLATRFGTFPAMTLEKVGYGLGTKNPMGGRANALRLVLGAQAGRSRTRAKEETRVIVVEATIDDMTPEQTGHLAERLSEAGALDVFLTPVQMKKGRPGVNVTVIVSVGKRDTVSQILFAEGTTLGLRMHDVERAVLERRLVSVGTPYGQVRVKEGLLAGRVVNRAPEYEDCVRLARRKKVPLKLVQQAALAASYRRK